MMRRLLIWAWRDLATEWGKLEPEKVGGGAYIFLIALSYLTVDFNGYAELTGQLWHVGDPSGQMMCQYLNDKGVQSFDPECLKSDLAR